MTVLVCIVNSKLKRYGIVPISMVECLIHIERHIGVKSGNFGKQVNSDIHLQTVNSQMRRLIKRFHQDFHCLLT